MVSTIGNANTIPTLAAQPFYLDSIQPSAIASFDKGLFKLNGATCAISALLNFSSASKYVVKADGSYGTSAANAPAYDWSSGRRRLLMECAAATNLMLNSEGNLATYDLSAGVAANAAVSIAGFGASVVIPNNSVVSAAYKYANTVVGTTYTLSVFIQTNDNTAPIAGVDSATGDFRLVMFSGLVPSVVSYIGNNIYRVSATGVAPATTVHYFGVVKYASQSIKGFRLTGMQLEISTQPTSYIPTVASSVTRVADVVTAAPALVSLLNSPDSTLTLRGTDLYSATGQLIASASGAGIALIAGNPRVDAGDAGQVHILPALRGGAASPIFGVTVADGASGRRVAYNGGAVASDTYGQFLPNETAYYFGSGAGGVLPLNLMLDELVVWPFFGSTLGVQGQARIYA